MNLGKLLKKVVKFGKKVAPIIIAVAPPAIEAIGKVKAKKRAADDGVG